MSMAGISGWMAQISITVDRGRFLSFFLLLGHVPDRAPADDDHRSEACERYDKIHSRQDKELRLAAGTAFPK
jgi:hypothetical protein